MRFRLPARLSDGISLPHHQVQAPGSFALMPENRLHLILLLTFDHHGRWWLVLPFELLGPLKPFEVTHMEDRMDPPGWGKVQSIGHWRNHLGDLEGSDPAPPQFGWQMLADWYMSSRQNHFIAHLVRLLTLRFVDIGLSPSLCDGEIGLSFLQGCLHAVHHCLHGFNST